MGGEGERKRPDFMVKERRGGKKDASGKEMCYSVLKIVLVDVRGSSGGRKGRSHRGFSKRARGYDSAGKKAPKKERRGPDRGGICLSFP